MDVPVKNRTEKILLIEKIEDLKNSEQEKEDETRHEEHGKQLEDKNNNEAGMKSQENRT